MNINDHNVYETPEIEVIEISFDQSIATSGTSGVGLWEELWG